MKSVKRFMIFFVLFVLLVQVTSTVSANSAVDNNVTSCGDNVNCTLTAVDNVNGAILTHKCTPDILIHVEGTKYGEMTKISVLVHKEHMKATGNVTLRCGNAMYVGSLHNGVATFYVGTLQPGIYNIQASYGGDVKFDPNNAIGELTIHKRTADMQITSFKYMNTEAGMVVKFNENATGQVRITIGNYSAVEDVSNGTAYFIIPIKAILDSGVDKAVVVYSGDNQFNRDVRYVSLR